MCAFVCVCGLFLFLLKFFSPCISAKSTSLQLQTGISFVGTIACDVIVREDELTLYMDALKILEK